MGLITIYRYTDVNDTPQTAEKLIFNAATQSKEPNGWILDVAVDPLEGLADNQGSEQEFGDQQALGSVEKEYTIMGKLVQRATNPHLWLETLARWQSETKINEHFPQGRFGITDEDDPTDDILPIPNTQPNPTGLIWHTYPKKSNMKGNVCMFTLKFRLSKGDGT